MAVRDRVLRGALTVGGLLALVVSGSTVAATSFAASATHAGPKMTIEPLLRQGTVKMGALPVRRGPASARTGGAKAPDIDAFIHREEGAAATPFALAASGPSPAQSRIVVRQSHLGFNGLSHLDQRLADNGNQFSLEPPDQGLCAGTVQGTRYVVETVNLAMNVYDGQTHQLLEGPVSLSQFYGLAPPINRTTGVFGPFTSDPKCYFDTRTQRWFHSILVIQTDPSTGAFGTHAYTLLAVSDTNDPLGTYHRYRIPATDPTNPNCPCFGDQPLIGADKYGFYVNTSEYSLGAGHTSFAQLYAIDKGALEAGTATSFVHFSNLTTDTGTIQPATTPSGRFAVGHGGTEYFMSSQDCIPPDCNVRPTPSNHISVWAMTNTSSLRSATPHVHLSTRQLTVGQYLVPPPQTQRQGPLVFGADPTENPDGKASKVESNDSRMNQVVFADGHLWSGINTQVQPGTRSGAEYFILKPSVGVGGVQASVRDGYVSAANANVSFPSVGVNDAGNGVVAFSLMGRHWFPSAAYQAINSSGTHGPVTVSRVGFRPEDGFTCYENPVTGLPDPTSVCRWGDYSASVALPDGTVWSATEYIGDGPRTEFANWGTFIWPTAP